MPDRPETEPVESVKQEYGEAQPASDEDVARSREQEELLGSSPGTTKDRSLTGESRPVDHDDVEGPVIDDDEQSSS